MFPTNPPRIPLHLTRLLARKVPKHDPLVRPKRRRINQPSIRRPDQHRSLPREHLIERNGSETADPSLDFPLYEHDLRLRVRVH